MTMPPITRADVLSIANGVSIAGLILTVYGALTITTLSGVIILGIGRFIDVFDGIIARRTHTSAFGALVDATCDKIGIVFLVSAVWVAGLAPIWLLSYVILQNLANVILSATTANRGAQPESSRNGKNAMFLQNVSIGFYALGATLSINALGIIGLIVGLSSMYFAYFATLGYLKQVPQK